MRFVEKVKHDVLLSQFTTLELGGPARNLVELTSSDDIVAAVRETDQRGEPLLVLAGGSNVVIADAGFAGTVALIRSKGMHWHERDDRAIVTIAAGHPFDEVVAAAVAENRAGIECLSGIPGSAGATPMQNVGAYGQEVAETIVDVVVYDRVTKDRTRFTPDECDFRYRDSIFKHTARYVVLEVTLALTRDALSRPLRYGELTRRLGVDSGAQVPLPEVRAAVLEVRRSKGMVIDPHDPDTRSVGSFFTNPVLDHQEWLALVARSGLDDIPHWTQGDGRVKVPAAWLIEQAGFGKGYGYDGVAISAKHPLALTNQGGGTTTALLKLAREIRDVVQARFGVTLTPEPVLIGETL